MSTFGWIFLVLNVVISLWSIWVNMHTRNGSGVLHVKTPVGWLWIWQLLGVPLVLVFNLSPWHLIWWFLVGFVVTIAIGKIGIRHCERRAVEMIFVGRKSGNRSGVAPSQVTDYDRDVLQEGCHP